MTSETALHEVADAITTQTGETIRRVVSRSAANSALIFTTHFVARFGLTANLCVESERACAEIARLGGIPAPEIVSAGYTSSGSGYLISKIIPGWRPRSEAALSSAGGFLARLHQLDRQGFPAEQHCRRRRRERYPIALSAVSLLDQASARWARPMLGAAAEDWRSCRTAPAHGDFGARNLLARGDVLLGIVDWTDARQASPESDLGQVDIADIPAVWSGYRRATRARIDFVLVAGHSLARYLALESFKVLVPGTSSAVATWWRQALDRERSGNLFLDAA